MSKPLRVKKFGGAVLSTPEKIKAIAAKLAEESKDYQLIIAVSAMGSTTNDLIKLAHAIATVPNRREMDLLLTVGERISMSLLAIALNELGCAAVSFTGSQAGIITEDVHGEAQIVEIKPTRVQEALSSRKIVIVAGYQGVSRSSKDVTTLGRGGTDITAVALACHFQAERCEILKEVPGIFSADPNLVPTAFALRFVGYDEFEEMTHWGAKVLNYRAAALAKERQVPLWIGPVGSDDQVSCISRKSMKDSGVFSINTWKEVLVIQTSGKNTDENLAILRQLEKDRSLTALHYLHEVNSERGSEIYLTGPTENIEEWKTVLALPLPGIKILRSVAAVTHSGSYLEEGTLYMSKNFKYELMTIGKNSRSYFIECEHLSDCISSLHDHVRKTLQEVSLISG